MARLQAMLRGETEWVDIEDSHPQAAVTERVQKMEAHGFTVKETDDEWRIVNPLTKQVECRYRIV